MCLTGTLASSLGEHSRASAREKILAGQSLLPPLWRGLRESNHNPGVLLGIALLEGLEFLESSNRAKQKQEFIWILPRRMKIRRV